MGGYQSDLVVTELRKAPGMELTKEALQKETALGTDDLREGVQEALESGLIAATEEGYRFVEDGDLTAVPVPPAAQPVVAVGETPGAGEPGEDEEPDAEPEEVEEAHAPPTGANDVDPAYRATYEVVVDYRLDEAGADDQEALSDAAGILSRVQEGVLEKWPDLAIRGSVKRVVVFDGAREIFRADG